MALAISGFDDKSPLALFDAADFDVLNLPTKAAHLLAADLLEFRSGDLGNAQIIVQHGLVHEGLVLAEDGDAHVVFGEKERGAQSTRPISDDDNIRHCSGSFGCWLEGANKAAGLRDVNLTTRVLCLERARILLF